MKRVCAVAGFGFMAGLIFCNFLFENSIIIFAAVLSVIAVLGILLPKIRARSELVLTVLSMLMACLCFSFVKNSIYSPSLAHVDEKCEIEATVLAYPTISSGGNYSYLIKTEKINGVKEKLRMMLYVPYELTAEPYDKVTLISVPFIIGSSEDGEESYYRYFRSRRTYTGVYTSYDVFVEKNEKATVLSALAKFKGRSVKILEKSLGGDFGAFSVSVLFGDKSHLSKELKDAFTGAGISHIMSVSGLHMSIWVFGLYTLLKKLSFSEKRAGLTAIVFSLIVVCLSSFSVSVIRAAIMTGVYLSAELFGRKADALNSLGLAVLILCAVNPFVVCDVSFLLSVFATLGIVASSKDCNRLLSKLDDRGRGGRLIRYFLDIVLISVIANIFVFPVTAGFFGSVSLLSWLSNLTVIPVLTPVMLLSGMLMLFPSVKVIAFPLKFVITSLEKYIFFCVRLVSALPFSYIQTENIIVYTVIPLVLTALALVWFCYKGKRISPAAVAVAAGILTVNICC